MIISLPIPCIPNHANLVVYPANHKVLISKLFTFIIVKLQGSTSVYLLSMDAVTPEWTHSRQVELLEGYVYCLLPSIGSEEGSVTVYKRMPTFISDIPYHHFFGKVHCLIFNFKLIL